MAMRVTPRSAFAVLTPAVGPSLPPPRLLQAAAAAPRPGSSSSSFRGAAGAGLGWLAAAACGVVGRRSRAEVQRRAVKEATKSVVVQVEKPKPKAKARPKPKAKAKAGKKAPPVPLADQAAEGIFAPVVIAGHATVGEPFVQKARGKGISLHARAIGAFCERFAIPNKKKAGFVKTAKNVGHDLGFMIPGGHFGGGLLGDLAMGWWKAAGVDKW